MNAVAADASRGRVLEVTERAFITSGWSANVELSAERVVSCRHPRLQSDFSFNVLCGRARLSMPLLLGLFGPQASGALGEQRDAWAIRC
jgi:hypothetical protein